MVEPIVAMREATQSTTEAIRVRSKRFRNLVIIIAAVMIGSVISTVVLVSWFPMMGLVLLVPLGGVFFYLDARLIDRWQQEILTMWAAGSLNIAVFSKAMASMPTLPLKTLSSMLDTLPRTPATAGSATIGTPTRKALAATLRVINRCQSERTAYMTLAATAGLACVALAAMARSWEFFWLLALLIPIAVGGRWLISHRLTKLTRWLLWLRVDEGLAVEEYVPSARQLDWEGIPTARRDSLFRSLEAAGEKQAESEETH